MIRQVSLLLLLLGVVCLQVNADQITLKNGDRVSGIVTQYDGKTIVVKSDLGDLSIAIR